MTRDECTLTAGISNLDSPEHHAGERAHFVFFQLAARQIPDISLPLNVGRCPCLELVTQRKHRELEGGLWAHTTAQGQKERADHQREGHSRWAATSTDSTRTESSAATRSTPATRASENPSVRISSHGLGAIRHWSHPSGRARRR